MGAALAAGVRVNGDGSANWELGDVFGGGMGDGLEAKGVWFLRRKECRGLEVGWSLLGWAQ